MAGVDPCQLVENIPGKSSSIRNIPVYRAAYHAIDKAQGGLKKLFKARKVLEKKTASLLSKGRDVFREKNETVKRRKIRRFLDKYVYGKTPALVLRDEGFELPTTISTTLSWLHCREGNFDQAIAYARPSHLSPGPLVAFAALLLVDKGRKKEAMELVPKLGDQGFLAPYMQAELITEFQEKLRFHRMAQIRGGTQAQRDAVSAQRQRYSKLGGR